MPALVATSPDVSILPTTSYSPVWKSTGMIMASHVSMRKKKKQDVCSAYIASLRSRGDVDVDAPGFVEAIQQHFDRLPTRYALDVNSDSLDVLSHRRLLDEARADTTSVTFAVRPVEVMVHSGRGPGSQQVLPKPAFGSSPNLQALAIESGESQDAGEASSLPDGSTNSLCGQHSHQNSDHSDHLSFYEITVASVDQYKLLSRLTDALGDLNLNIHEAHAFNTSDGYSLDVFVVDKTESQSGECLEEMLSLRLGQMPPPPGSEAAGASVMDAARTSSGMHVPQTAQIPIPNRPPSPEIDDWEIDIQYLQIETKIASGAFGNLYRGSYCGQEVAIKILKDVNDDTTQFQEFLQEVSIMRKVRHKHVVQFIGACTRRPNLCIVFEYMSGGSIHDHIRRDGPLTLSRTIKLLTDVSRGMDYLHQRKIIHRDLKAANLLVDEHGIVKIGDFGVSRVIETAGCMTAETGTYRWMAPEVIEHTAYDNKADVFSFAILIWELLTCRVPYGDMTPLQAAVGVVQRELRPGIPDNCPPVLGDIMKACWAQDPASRPSFLELTRQLQLLQDAAREEDSRRAAAAALASKPSGGLFSRLRNIGGGRD